MKSDNFFAELKRRNVIRMAGLYLVGAWFLTQVTSTILPMFGAPEWLPRSIVILLALAFIPALIFSWVFELTPEGLKRDEDVAPEKSIAPQTARRMDRMIIVVLLLAVGYFAFDKFVLAPRRQQIPAPNDREASVSTKSIAVLPFDNLSRDPDNAYFCEGVQDEILTRLAKVADLKVIARASTQKFKSSPENLPEIAKQLGILHILEGSIQKSGDQVRLNVQLVNALTETHLWAETYDRKLTDIFAVESEIAKTIADRLQAQLTGSEKTAIATKPTVNPEAYEFYLKGRHFWNRRTESGLRKATELFQQAIDKDPAFALAYAGIADCYSVLPSYSDDPPKPNVDRAIAAARRAIQLDDSLAEGHTALGNALSADLQLPEAEAAFKRAFALNSNYASAHQWYGETLQSLGRFDEAIAELRRARDLDPLSLIINAIFAGTLYSAGKYDEALQQTQRTMDLDPNFGVAYWVRGQIHESKGEFEDAIADFKKSGAATLSHSTKAVIACTYARSGRTAEAQNILDDLLSQSQHRFVASYWMAEVQAVLGNRDEAIRLLEKAFDERSIPIGSGGIGGPKIDNRFDSLRGDPRFQKVLARFTGEFR